jgi:antitoxin CptB
MPDDHELSRLRWRCRRGMRELDTLLLAYVESQYSAASRAEQSAFCQLLTMPDPDILALLTGRLVADDESLRHVIERLLERT